MAYSMRPEQQSFPCQCQSQADLSIRPLEIKFGGVLLGA